MYKSCDVKIVPVALNSGLFWPKNGILKKRGTILIEFLKPIDKGLDKEKFIEKLTREIEEASQKIKN